MSQILSKAFIQKYNVAGPRYTSYPTAPNWEKIVNEDAYIKTLAGYALDPQPLSLYIHIPFCTSLCYFCACNVTIRKRRPEVADEYLNYLFKEIEKITFVMKQKQAVKQLHFGGGTPNFLSDDQLSRLMRKLHQHFDILPQAEIASEIDPRVVTVDYLRLLQKLGFNRLSMGVQDFDLVVQKAINRIQPYDMVSPLVKEIRVLGFESLNIDLIYGLPFQTVQKFSRTIKLILSLRPDRIALYSYAHVPWLKSHQKLLNSEMFPDSEEKLDIFVSAQAALVECGYLSIAMDHFALSTDALAQAFRDRKLYRNFMGYTLKPTRDFFGLGVSSISFIQNHYFQNTKVLKDYYRCLAEGKFSLDKGMKLSLDDQRRRWVINQLMCHFEVNKTVFEDLFQIGFLSYFRAEQAHLDRCESESLIIHSEDLITVTSLGKLFIRNICMGFDHYLETVRGREIYSSTV